MRSPKLGAIVSLSADFIFFTATYSKRLHLHIPLPKQLPTPERFRVLPQAFANILCNSLLARSSEQTERRTNLDN